MSRWMGMVYALGAGAVYALNVPGVLDIFDIGATAVGVCAASILIWGD